MKGMSAAAGCALGLALLAIFGALLARRAWWSRRFGTAAHCRRCNYNLTGITSSRCPECGVDLSSGNIVRGERRQPGIAGWAGVLLLCLSLSGLGGLILGSMAHVDWYRYRPFGWVMADTHRAATALHAWAEVQRRHGAGALDESQEQAIVERALREQAAAEAGPATAAMMKFLDNVAFAGSLTKVQRSRFVAEATRAELTVAPASGARKQPSYRVLAIGRGGDDVAWLRNIRGLVAVDGEVVDADVEDTSWGVGGMSFGGTLPPMSPGRHRVSVVVNVRVGVDEISLFGETSIEVEPQILTADVDIASSPATWQPATR